MNGEKLYWQGYPQYGTVGMAGLGGVQTGQQIPRNMMMMRENIHRWVRNRNQCQRGICADDDLSYVAFVGENDPDDEDDGNRGAHIGAIGVADVVDVVVVGGDCADENGGGDGDVRATKPSNRGGVRFDAARSM